MRHKGRWQLLLGPLSSSKKPNSEGISIYCPDFYVSGKPLFWQGKTSYELSTEGLRELLTAFLLQEKPGTLPLSKALWQEPRLEDFAYDLDFIQKRIANQEIQKAVPVVFARSPQTVTPIERAQMLLNLLSAPETLYLYGFWQNAEGILGATPEVLCEYADGVLATMALAGTCPVIENGERLNLLEDAKEMHEHILVRDDIVQMLKTYGPVEVGPTHVLNLPTLSHLKTDLRVHCKVSPDMVALIQALHPTPALGVAPRQAGYHWMQALPGQEGRRRFGGPFAFISPSQAVCLVAIRNIQWNSQETLIGSGCGVVAASELQREWRELQQKRQSVKKILGFDS